MRRLVLAAGLVAAAVLAVPAHASGSSDLVRVRNDERGVGASVGPEAHAIVGVGVDYDGTACVAIGFWGTCVPE